jgi:hypothetical protein
MGFLPVLAEIVDKMPTRWAIVLGHLTAGIVLLMLSWGGGRWALLFAPVADYWVLMVVGEFYQDAYFHEAVVRELGAGYAACAVAASCLPLVGLLTGVCPHHRWRERCLTQAAGASSPAS